jgi:hypothetical protein
MTRAHEPTTVSWTETFKGWLGFGQTDFNQAMLPENRERARAKLTVSIPHLESFLADQPGSGPDDRRPRSARVTSGWIRCDGFAGPLTVTEGTFEAFVPAAVREPTDQLHLRMRYTLQLTGPDGEPFVLRGFKLIENDPGYDSWSDTTTLFVQIFPGDPAAGEGAPLPVGGGTPVPVRDGTPLAVGVLCISPLAFLRELATFRASGRSVTARVKGVGRYQWFFASSLARTYLGPPVSGTRPSFPLDRTEPSGVELPRRADADTPEFEAVAGTSLARSVIPFEVQDLAFPLNLHRLRKLDGEGQPVPPTRGPVLLVPGSGVRAEMYYGQPLGPSFAEFLLDEGYDVWVESWRASIDLPPTAYTLDQAAMIDHPRAVETILEICDGEGGGDALKAVVHCQGSISFMMAAVAGRLDARVTQIVSSAVSLYIEVRGTTWLKQRLAVPTVGRLFTWADAQWAIRPVTPAAALFAATAKLMERPCGNPPCQMANFMYGSGWDVLLRHRDDAGQPWIADAVHEWTGRELGYTPMSLIGQVAESSRHGHIVPSSPRPIGTPASYLLAPPQTRAQITFVAGDHNNMFRWEGQRRSKDFFDETAGRGQADFVLLPGFGHLDTFWALQSPAVAYPVILDGLEWRNGEPPPSARKGALTSGRSLPRREGTVTDRGRKLRRRAAAARFVSLRRSP